MFHNSFPGKKVLLSAFSFCFVFAPSLFFFRFLACSLVHVRSNTKTWMNLKWSKTNSFLIRQYTDKISRIDRFENGRHTSVKIAWPHKQFGIGLIITRAIYKTKKKSLQSWKWVVETPILSLRFMKSIPNNLQCAHDVCKCEYMRKYFDLHMTLMWL